MKKKIAFLYVLLILFLVIGAVSVYFLLTMETEPSVMKEYDYDEVQDLVEPSQPNPEQDACSAPTVPVPEDPLTQEPEAPAASEPEDTDCVATGPSVNYDPEAMFAINKDFQGWLYIPDTPISLPVVQAPNNDYYLNVSFTGKWSAFGCLFFDPDTPAGSDNRVIHGHNMGRNRDEMFAPLVDYLDPQFAASHSSFSFTEPYSADDKYEVFSILQFDIRNLSEFDYTKASFETDQERSEFIEYLRSRSSYATDFIPEGDILILSTCYGPAGTTNRLLICGGKRTSTAAG